MITDRTNPNATHRTISISASTNEPWAMQALYIALHKQASAAGFGDMDMPSCTITLEVGDFFDSEAAFEASKAQYLQELRDMGVLDSAEVVGRR